MAAYPSWVYEPDQLIKLFISNHFMMYDQEFHFNILFFFIVQVFS